MALPADLSAATAVSAETDLPRMKVTHVGAVACICLQCVHLQSVPPGHLPGVDRYEAAEWCGVPLETPAKRGALFRKAEVTETGAEGTQEIKRVEGTLSACLLYTSPSPRD